MSGDMLRRLLFLSLSCGLVSVSSRADAVEQSATKEPAKDTDYIARIGVASLTPDLVSLAAEKLPLGFYKDYSCFGRENPVVRSTLTYMPVIQYKSKSDSKSARSLVSVAWRTGQLPKLPGTELKQLLVAMSLSEFEDWLADHTGADGIPDGTVFLLGNEPGYRPNSDDRTAKEIVQDAVLIKDVFSRHNLKHQLALGGISTPKNRLAREAYGGKLGNEFFREILAEAHGKVAFDAFVIHPYPSDILNLSAQDSFEQIIEFRCIMDEFGQRNKPLFVGEVGVPFLAARDKRDEVCRYAEELIELCLTGRDPELGLLDDDNRLVQRFTWYLLSPPRIAIAGYTDNPGLDLEASALMLADGTLTDIGEALVRTVKRLVAAAR
jgi:hypothetical protein